MSESAPSAHIDVHYVAALARLELTPEEESAYNGQLDRILEYVTLLNEVDVSSVPDTGHWNDNFDCTRADVSRPGIGQEATLSNAPRRSGDQFLVPKVVE